MSTVTSRRKRANRFADLAEARRKLADAHLALTQASHHDPEAISEARLAFNTARQGLRDLMAKHFGGPRE